MGFKEGMVTLVFVAIAAPFIFRITSSGPLAGTFLDDGAVALGLLLYVMETFLERGNSSGYLAASVINAAGGARRATIQGQPKEIIHRKAGPPGGPGGYGGRSVIASSFKFRRR